jgi:hypothetical protein
MSTINIELEPELIKETITALNTKAHKVRLERAEKDRELETLSSRIKTLESAIIENGKKHTRDLPIVLSGDFKPVEVTDSGRRPYGASSETMLSVLKGANGSFMKTKTIVELSGTAYGSAYRILRAFEKVKKVRRNDKGEWALY